MYSSSKEQSESCLKIQIEFICGEERVYTPFMWLLLKLEHQLRLMIRIFVVDTQPKHAEN